MRYGCGDRTGATMGPADRATRQPWIPLVWAAKAGADAVLSAKLTFDQASRYRAFCLWCLLAASATFATLPLAIPEARAAARHLLRKITETG